MILDAATRVIRASGAAAGPAEVCATFRHMTDLPATCVLFKVVLASLSPHPSTLHHPPQPSTLNPQVRSAAVGVSGVGWPDPLDLRLEKNDVRPIGAPAENARAVMQPLVFNVSVKPSTLNPQPQTLDPKP